MNVDEERKALIARRTKGNLMLDHALAMLAELARQASEIRLNLAATESDAHADYYLRQAQDLAARLTELAS